MTSPSPAIMLQAWTVSSSEARLDVVLPDGCQDLIARISRCEKAQWFVADLNDTAYSVATEGGERFIGYRFQPGAMIDKPALLNAVRNYDGDDRERAFSAIAEYVHLDGQVAEALACLATTRTIPGAARTLGLCERSLERLVLKRTGRTPGFWKNLARIRRAAKALGGQAPLSEIAAGNGYADQAHMTRDFIRWFGISPGRFRIMPDQMSTIAQPGYG